MAPVSACLAEDDLLELSRAGALAASPEVEAHLADCASCSALLAAVLDAGGDAPRWGAMAGRSLGPYRLEEQIGAGAMGAVYRGWDQRLRRGVAVKLLPPHGGGSAELARRLEVEARAAAAIAHRNVVTVFDVGSDEGIAYVVQELVDGESLRSLLDRGRLPRPRALELGLDLLRGLEAAHATGVVHRDLKPENLLVTADGTLKILDFGLAKLAGDAGLDATEPGTVQGTAGYMAPEQARGEPADARADLFAAGAILYELLTGRRAFPGASHAERLSAVLRDTPPLDDPAIGDLAPALGRCLERDPRRRFQSAADVAWLLERGAPPLAVARRRPRVTRRDLLIGGLAGAAGLALGRLTRRSVAPATPPQLRQLTFRPGRVASARFSRDGGSVLYGAAWDGGPVSAYALRLDGGLTRPLEIPPADVLSVSSRGELAISLGRRHTDGQSATGRLALVPIDGGVPRPLLDDVQDCDFTPDGRELAVVRPAGRGFRLELPAGNLLHETEGWITDPRVSPDGRRVAFLLHPSSDDDRGDLQVIDRAGGGARPLSEGWGSIAGLAWHPDGTGLWTTASRETANNVLYHIPLDGDPRVILSAPGRLRLHDAVGADRLAISRDAWRLRTLVRPAPDAAPVDRSLSEFSLAADITPDGETLLMGELGYVDPINGVYLVPTAGGTPLRLGHGLPLAVSPDGRRVAALRFDPAPGYVAYTREGGEAPPLGLGPIRTVQWARWIDTDRLVISGNTDGRPPRLWRVSVGTDPPVPLTGESVGGRFELDPARRRAALIDPAGSLTIVNEDGSGVRQVAGGLRGQLVCAWLTGESVIVRNKVTPVVLTRIDLATGAASPYLEIAPPPLGLRAVDAVVLHPHSGRYAYSYGQELSQLYLATFSKGG